MNNTKNIYIASCAEDGGIYQYRLADNSKLELVEKTELDRPMYMVADNNKMYIILREPFENDSSSGVIVYDIDEDGRLVNPSEIQSTMGEVACHIMVDGNDVYCANYVAGSAIKLPDNLVVHSGQGVNLPRQNKAHVHFVGLTPDSKYVCVADLGLDTIFLYNKDMTLHSLVKVPEGHGARHLIFSEDGKYMFCANELKSTLSVFSYSNGELSLIDTVNLLPDDFKEKNTAAAIRIRDGLIYVSNRGFNSVSEVEFADGKMKLMRNIDCGGEGPRDFDFMDSLMICTNENSNNVAVINFETLEKVGNYEHETPLCVMFR